MSSLPTDQTTKKGGLSENCYHQFSILDRGGLWYCWIDHKDCISTLDLVLDEKSLAEEYPSF